MSIRIAHSYILFIEDWHAHRSARHELVRGRVCAVQEDAAARGAGGVLAEGSGEDDAVRCLCFVLWRSVVPGEC